MIAAGLLGVALIGLAKLHINSIKGTVQSEDISRAAEVARGIADTFATLPFDNIPTGCPPGPTAPPTWVNPPAAEGCSASLGPTTQFNPEKGPGCTAWYDFDGVPDSSNAAWVADPMAGDGSAPDTGNFRVDLAVSAHPREADFPSSASVQPGQEAVQVLWIWVCWRDSNGVVHEVSSTRVVSQGL